MLSDFDKKVLRGVERFGPVSSSYLSRVINAPIRPIAVRKNRHFDSKYQLTNGMVANLKQENEFNIEKSFRKLNEMGKIYQSVPGEPKRYSTKYFMVKETVVKEKFDDDRFSINDSNEEYTDDPKINQQVKEGFKQDIVH